MTTIFDSVLKSDPIYGGFELVETPSELQPHVVDRSGWGTSTHSDAQVSVGKFGVRYGYENVHGLMIVEVFIGVVGDGHVGPRCWLRAGDLNP